ncbi:2,3,4,5-tetrahydropyridine-2,6-carboxylate N-succinyltransferase [Parasedimentitalea marina]|uniref:2,3,4,5-tetrahydropyridine-2,6-carboxylate N-succinyltransferase n=1 Tax=Parasedimentitalea marina TaxID=2483033 RepID=A0A3T0N3E8_9RHOB|nr:choice-of-anchor L domain-containing protein [Parasedimentitalea marina]AZV78502.1 2,3,4,5-tetrahydropyridine-2,6-carboxylate N-succinyltransferase [Parasedimentitalea marina]
MPTASELPIDTSATASDMADAMFGNGITIVSASYSGAQSASGIYTNGDEVAPDITPSDTGVILSTGRADDITNSSGDVNTSASTSTNHQLDGTSDLDAIAGMTTYDAAVFEATFIPEGTTLTMQITFSSEEYLEYVNEGFNDAVGVWVNGEQAELTIGEGDISIDNINDGSNENLYVDNAQSDDTYNTEMDGFTVTLTLKATVIPGEENTITIGIADAGDHAYDSNLLIAGDSVQTALIATDDEFTINGDGALDLDILGNDIHAAGSSLTITHINGQPVSSGDTVTLATGEEVTLNADGTFSIVNGTDVEETNTFSYTVEDDLGNSDVGFVQVTTAPCFVAGTLIDTVDGPVPVEELEPGMQVQTRDHGPQKLRWIGQTTRLAQGSDAPVVLAANALGNHRRIALSPNHRILISTDMAELLFGQAEVLVKAKDLVNDHTIKIVSDGRSVTYVHVLFDQHEIICGNGLETESYHPGAETLESFDIETRSEILEFMEEMNGYGPTARLVLKSHEGRLLMAQ